MTDPLDLSRSITIWNPSTRMFFSRVGKTSPAGSEISGIFFSVSCQASGFRWYVAGATYDFGEPANYRD
jgi:hypothetical protein